MPSIARSQEDSHRRRGRGSSRASRSWQPVEIETGRSFDSAEHAAPPTISMRNGTESDSDDTVSLLSEPGNTPLRPARRRRRTAQTVYESLPHHHSNNNNNNESKVFCFPVYGCASFLLSILVAAIFVIPMPTLHHEPAGQVLQCRRTVWQNFGYLDDDVGDDDDDDGALPAFITDKVDSRNATATDELDWAWFLAQVDQTEEMDRCRAGLDPTVAVSCACRNPTQAWNPELDMMGDNQAMEYIEQWEIAFLDHQERLKKEAEAVPQFTDLEVIMLGDSLTEHWLGTSVGQPRPSYQGNAQVFESLLRDNHEKRPYIHTTPFGISGDRCGQALYRIQHDAVVPPERIGIQTVL